MNDDMVNKKANNIGCFAIIITMLILSVVFPLLIIIIVNHIFGCAVLPQTLKTYLSISGFTFIGLIIILLREIKKAKKNDRKNNSSL